MKFNGLKHYLPRSLLGRAIMILVAPIVLIQLVVGYAFVERLFGDVTRQMTSGVALEINYLLERIEQSQSLNQALSKASAVAQSFEMTGSIADGDHAPRRHDDRLFYDLSGRYAMQQLRADVAKVRSIDLRQNFRKAFLEIDTRFGMLELVLPRVRLSASNPHQLLVAMILASILLTVIALLFLRNQVKPIARLAEAAEAFGKGQSVPLRITGATEVRRAANTFVSMRSRIERQIEQRTLMLSGVSHDLRTPLTRMKLSLSLLEENPEIEELKQDVDEMQRMLDEFLAFARGDSVEDAVKTDPVKLAQKCIKTHKSSDAEIKLIIEGLTHQVPKISLRKQAITRALDNLLGNAIRYGNRVVLRVTIAPKYLEYRVEDNGPGIAPELREQALKPFTRLDVARNQNMGSGVGLGLSITADIARSHGGTLTLGQSEELGGLRARFRIPR